MARKSKAQIAAEQERHVFNEKRRASRQAKKLATDSIGCNRIINIDKVHESDRTIMRLAEEKAIELVGVLSQYDTQDQNTIIFALLDAVKDNHNKSVSEVQLNAKIANDNVGVFYRRAEQFHKKLSDVHGSNNALVADGKPFIQ